MEQAKMLAKELLGFIDNSPSCYHVTENFAEMLKNQGYRALNEQDKWDIQPGGKYFVTRNGSSIIAFRVPQTVTGGFLMAAAHSDSPTFKIKENPEHPALGHYVQLNTEKYGGSLMATWFDRPLSVAGRVLVETDGGIATKNVCVDRDLLVIPSVAIHMNRNANDGYKWNPAVDTLPLMGGKDAKGKFTELLEEAAGGKILGHDLYLYIRQKSSIWGLNEEYISSAALDDLECAWACTQGFLQAKETANIPVLAVFDNEEVGSGSYQGAAADFLESTLARICQALTLDESCQKAKSFLVSADNGHALHPNHPELSDASNAPVVNGGVVIKFNATLKYTTDGLTAAIFRKICQKAEVPVQTYCNRADIAGGSTLGNVSLHQVAVPSVDIGLAQLAMHSCYETAGVADVTYLKKAMTAYYSATLKITEKGGFSLK